MSRGEWTAANHVALAALAASALLCAAAVAEARRVDPLPGDVPAARPATMPQVAARRASSGDARVLAAVARDPFRADRRRPPGRYRMPGEPAPSPGPVYAPAAPPPPAFTLVGTVVLANGRGLAAVAGAGGTSRLLRVGEEMDGFRVLRVGNGTAALSNGDTTLLLKTDAGTP